MERYFSKNSDGTVEFTPKAVNHARREYRQLIESLSDFRKMICCEQNLLDITPKENDVLKRDCLNNLIIYKVELREIENCFISVKRWYDKNNLPYPHSAEDQRKKELLEDYISRKKKFIGRKSISNSEDLAKIKKEYDKLKREKENQNKEHQILVKKIKMLTIRSRNALGNLTNQELEQLVENNRKINGTINFAALGRQLGRDPKTIKNEIERRGLTWLYNAPN